MSEADSGNERYQTSDEALLSMLEVAGRDLPLPQPPEAVTRLLQEVFQGQAEIQWTEAQLIHDSRTDDVLVGARGPSDPSVWTATYCAPTADLVIDGVYEADGTITTSGQIFPLDSGSPAFTISLQGPSPASVFTDDLGQFELGSLQPGSYLLRASNDRYGVTLAFEGIMPPSGNQRQ